ncbi:MAG: type II toxin-antitoxin system Phd/YefM family antitoxin [Alphaproteobacteria bacterium]
MTHIILTNVMASITEFKKHPMATVMEAEGEPIAILNRNEPVFYCVPTKMFEAMMDVFEDIHLAQIVRDRAGEEEIKVDVNDL